MSWSLMMLIFSLLTATNGLFLKRNTIAHFDKLEFTTDPNMVSMNASIHDVTLSAYTAFLVDVPAPIKVVLIIKHFANGAYVRSFMNIEIEICGFVKTSDQNPIAKKIYDFVRSYGKIPNRCPLKRDVYYVKDVEVPSFLLPAVLPSDKYRVDFQAAGFLNVTVYMKLVKK